MIISRGFALLLSGALVDTELFQLSNISGGNTRESDPEFFFD
jgi:hypothetical protein